MDLEQIKAEKMSGDITRAAEMLGLNQSNTTKALYNPKSKRHADVISTMSVIIETRNILKKALS